MKKSRILILALFFMGVVACAQAAVPRLINYQGRITDKSGTPLNGASFTLVFGIYDAKASGNLLWQGTYSNVTIAKGVFNILLGDVNDAGYNFDNLAFDKPYWLQIKVGSDVMAPRQEIISAAYAMRAENADKAKDSETVSGIGASVAPTPNKLLPLDDKAKLPLSALKVYDSGWFAVSNGRNYTKTHNLGTTKVLITWWFSPNPDGSNAVITAPGQNDWYQPGGGSHHQGSSLNHLTTTAINLSTFGDDPFTWMDSDGSLHGAASGYARVIMLALE